MIFELLSRGTIAELPDGPVIAGCGPDDVILLLPYKRYLRGKMKDGYESWKLCKLGSPEEEEIFLYEGEARHLNFEDGHQAVVPRGAVDKLKSALFASSPPPGEHFQAAAVLKGILEPDIAGNELFVFDEAFALERLDKKIEAKAAYWAARLALSRGDYDTISRIKIWYRTAPHIAFSEPGVMVWFSLAQMPDAEAVSSMASLGISEENINRVAAQTVSPVVLFSKNGYLLFASYGDGQRAPIFREWAYFPAPVWNELRERRRLTLRELLTAAWGANDAREALKTSSLYKIT